MSSVHEVIRLPRPLTIPAQSTLEVSITGDEIQHGILFCNLAKMAIFNKRTERILAITDSQTHLKVHAQEGTYDSISFTYESFDNRKFTTPLTVHICIE